ncbi:MAG: hypothetical protein WCP28_15140 [Actinomycetes bacterium]
MSSMFRENAVQALRTADEERPQVRLVPARRWLIAVALVVMVLAGVIFAVIASTRTPIRGIGYIDHGGFITLTAQEKGIVQDGVAVPGTQVNPGDVVARVITTKGTTVRVVAPGPGVVMQLLGPAAGWPVEAGEPILVIAGIGREGGSKVALLLPGLEATELTEGSVSEGGTVWLEPAGKDAIHCVITSVRPYAQPADSLVKFMPDPFVVAYVRDQGSIQFAEADCPADQLAEYLPGTAFPVTVEIDPKRPIDYVFGS